MTQVNRHDGYQDLFVRSHFEPTLVVQDNCLHIPSNSRLVSLNELAIQPMSRGAVFLDRDGVLIKDVHYLRNPSQLRILPRVVEALQSLQKYFYLIVITNQSGVGRGFFTEADLLEIHGKLIQGLAAEGALVDGLYYCPHHPEAIVPAYRVICQCRKPKPDLLLRAKHEWNIDMTSSFMIGDKVSDIQAGVAANTKGILLSNEELSLPSGCILAANLGDAAHQILTEMERERLI